MKKIFSIFLLTTIFILTGCTSKNAPAEVTIIDDNAEEVKYQIHVTDNEEEVKEIFKNLNKAKPNNLFNGFSLELDSDISGKVKINDSSTIIDLGYAIKSKAEANLIEYRMSGNVILDGFTNTESDSLSLQTKNSLSLDLFNDDDYLYFKGIVNTGSNFLSIKNKLNITEFTKKNKAIIQSSIDLLKYYTIINMIEDTDSWIEAYQITVVKTNKNSFTIRLHISSKDIYPEVQIDTPIDVDVEISCETILPIRLTMTADTALQEILKNQYVKDYLTDNVQIQDSKFSVDIKLKYGYYTIQEVPTEEKELYSEYTI